MAPMPNREHQDRRSYGDVPASSYWARPRGRECTTTLTWLRLAAGRTTTVSDLVLLTPERIDRNEYFEGAPDVVVEIRSPGDESYEKLEFYAQLGVREYGLLTVTGKPLRSTCGRELYTAICQR